MVPQHNLRAQCDHAPPWIPQPDNCQPPEILVSLVVCCPVLPLVQDYYQLLSPCVSVLHGGFYDDPYTLEDFKAQEELADPKLWRDVKALMGDAADNIPGLKAGSADCWHPHSSWCGALCTAAITMPCGDDGLHSCAGAALAAAGIPISLSAVVLVARSCV